MSLILRAKAREILSNHEEWLRKELEDWPNGCCFDTCTTIEEDIREAFPTHDFRQRRGYFYEPGWQEYCEGHVWIQGNDGTIIDPTVSQFIGGHPLQVFEAKDPACELYLPGKPASRFDGVHEDTAARLAVILRGICDEGSPYANMLAKGT